MFSHLLVIASLLQLTLLQGQQLLAADAAAAAVTAAPQEAAAAADCPGSVCAGGICCPCPAYVCCPIGPLTCAASPDECLPLSSNSTAELEVSPSGDKDRNALTRLVSPSSGGDRNFLARLKRSSLLLLSEEERLELGRSCCPGPICNGCCCPSPGYVCCPDGKSCARNLDCCGG